MAKKYDSKFIEDTIPKASAYWISPQSKVIPMDNHKKHIDLIMSNAEVFGLTDEEIKAIYNSENEIIGTEGKAREQIIKKIISQGWIRIRHYRRPDIFSINVYKLDNKSILYKFAADMIKQGEKFTDVKIDTASEVIRTNMNDIVNSKSLKKSKRNVKLTIYNNFDEYVEDFNKKDNKDEDTSISKLKGV